MSCMKPDGWPQKIIHRNYNRTTLWSGRATSFRQVPSSSSEGEAPKKEALWLHDINIPTKTFKQPCASKLKEKSKEVWRLTGGGWDLGHDQQTEQHQQLDNHGGASSSSSLPAALLQSSLPDWAAAPAVALLKFLLNEEKVEGESQFLRRNREGRKG